MNFDTHTSVKSVILFILTLASIHFSKDAIEKFQKKTTGFKTLTKDTSDMRLMPAIVICFRPIAKQSILMKYDLDLTQLFTGIPKGTPGSWSKFKEEAFYQLNKDVFIRIDKGLTDFGYHTLEEGTNVINGKVVTISKLLTLYSGLCYKVTYANFEAKPPSLTIQYSNETIANNDNGKPELFITSKESANGILDMNWPNGEELKLEMKNSYGALGSDNVFKIFPIQHV